MGVPGVSSAHYTKMSISITQEWLPGCGSLTEQWSMDRSQCYFLRGVNLVFSKIYLCIHLISYILTKRKLDTHLLTIITRVSINKMIEK